LIDFKWLRNENSNANTAIYNMEGAYIRLRGNIYISNEHFANSKGIINYGVLEFLNANYPQAIQVHVQNECQGTIRLKRAKIHFGYGFNGCGALVLEKGSEALFYKEFPLHKIIYTLGDFSISGQNIDNVEFKDTIYITATTNISGVNVIIDSAYKYSSALISNGIINILPNTHVSFYSGSISGPQVVIFNKATFELRDKHTLCAKNPVDINCPSLVNSVLTNFGTLNIYDQLPVCMENSIETKIENYNTLNSEKGVFRPEYLGAKMDCKITHHINTIKTRKLNTNSSASTSKITPSPNTDVPIAIGISSALFAGVVSATLVYYLCVNRTFTRSRRTAITNQQLPELRLSTSASKVSMLAPDSRGQSSESITE